MGETHGSRDEVTSADALDDDEEDLEPQEWHRYDLSYMINTAWLADSITPEHIKAFGDGWDTLVVIPEWRSWSEQHLVPAFPYLSLDVRDDRETRLLRKTKTGVAMHLPARELFEAEADGDMVGFYAALIHTIYTKWAQVAGCPPPPDLPSAPAPKT